MNQGNLEVVKQEMARMNIDILGMGKFNWDRRVVAHMPVLVVALYLLSHE